MTTILGAVGLLYSVIHNLSFNEIIVFVFLPATLIGLVVSLAMLFRASQDVTLGLALGNAETKVELKAVKDQLKATEDRLGSQIARLGYGDVIQQAEREGWSVTDGERGSLHFSHEKWGSAGTGGDEDIDPDRLRLLLSMGRAREEKRPD